MSPFFQDIAGPTAEPGMQVAASRTYLPSLPPRESRVLADSVFDATQAFRPGFLRPSQLVHPLLENPYMTVPMRQKPVTAPMLVTLIDALGG